LIPIAPQQPARTLPDPPPLIPAMTKPSAVSAAPAPLLPAVNQPVPPPRTLYFQKDPAVPAKPQPPSNAPAAPAKPVVQQVAAMQPPGEVGEVRLPPPIRRIITQIGLPSNEVLFSLQTENQIIQQLKAEVGDNPTFSKVPKDLPLNSQLPPEQRQGVGGYEPLSTVAFTGRNFPPITRQVEPGYITHHRLYFEEPNAERYGWEAGPLQPFVSVGYYFFDFGLLPYKFMTRHCQRYDTNYGKCLPGDPVPYLLYPVELSVTGGLAEAGTIVALFALFP
jgi:hypothetical protein